MKFQTIKKLEIQNSNRKNAKFKIINSKFKTTFSIIYFGHMDFGHCNK